MQYLKTAAKRVFSQAWRGHDARQGCAGQLVSYEKNEREIVICVILFGAQVLAFETCVIVG